MIPRSPLACVMLLLFIFSACSDEEREVITYSQLDVAQMKEFQNMPKDSVICHIISQHLEDCQTTETEDYETHYDVVGKDQKGNVLMGYADIEGKYGEGILEDEMGNEVEIDVEWAKDGKLKATDCKGNIWKLTVE